MPIIQDIHRSYGSHLEALHDYHGETVVLRRADSQFSGKLTRAGAVWCIDYSGISSRAARIEHHVTFAVSSISTISLVDGRLVITIL